MSINWQPWGESAFAQAQRENKPVLLAIGAVWCHWCHVMDRTTYDNPDVAAAINERYVPVRVDNDERPDINARYNMGGWPTTAFLSADGSILTGATYLPPEQMLRALDDIAHFYAEKRDEIEARSREIRDARRTYAPGSDADLQPHSIDSVRASLEDAFDDDYAGFGDAPKFPQPEALEFLLTEWRISGDARLFDMVARTIREMSRGGMYDHVEGGFFRYSTTRDWSVPHFEKMSEDHAGLLRVLAQLLLWARAADLRPTLLSAGRYVRTTLRAPNGLFYGSQDADEAYYALPLEERRAIEAPYVDNRCYAKWSADLAGAFCWTALALDDEQYANDALAALTTLHESPRSQDGLLYHVFAADGSVAVPGIFADQAAYVRALLDAYEITGVEELLERAGTHARATIAAFGAPDGGFFDHRSIDAIGRLGLPDRPIVDNALFAESLLRLAAIDGDDELRAIARQTLLLYAPTFRGAGAFGAPYARAMRRFLREPLTLAVGPGFSGRDALVEASRRLPDPFVNVAPGHETTAHLCVGTRCGEPFSDPAQLRERYEALVF